MIELNKNDTYHLFNEIEFWSTIYELNFQFWPRQNNIYISKEGIDLIDFGGGYSMIEICQKATKYLRRINPKMYRTYLGLKLSKKNQL